MGEEKPSKLGQIRALGGGEMSRRFAVSAQNKRHPEEGPRVVHPDMARDLELNALKIENAKLKAKNAELRAINAAVTKPAVTVTKVLDTVTKAPTVTKPTCRQCGKPLEIPASGRPKVYCSGACRMRAQRAKDAAKPGKRSRS
jgi:hypothetical protein